MNITNKKMANKLLSIIVPFFDEQKIIRLFYRELVKNLDSDYNYQIIFVNDGSTDKGLNIIKGIAKKDSRVKYLSLQKNYGQQAAIYSGLRFARGTAVIIMDCDLQDPPSLIPRMIEAWEKGAKIVLPLRQERQDHWSKKVSAAAFYAIFNLCRKSKLNPAIGEFYLLDNSARSQLLNEVTEPLFLRGSVQHLSYKKQLLPYARGPRFAGQSGFSFLKMLRLARDAFYSQTKVWSTKKVAQVLACSPGLFNSYLIQESNIYKDKTAAVIGAGKSGLTLALYLVRLGVKVSLYEKDSKVGGLMTSEMIHGQRYDRHYHHIFKNDRDFLELISSLGLGSKLHWHTSHVGAFINNRLYTMNSLVDLLRLPVMSLGSKLQMLVGALRLSKEGQPTKNGTAKSVIRNEMGQAAWDRFWQPVIKSKFGLFSSQISAAWFQARLKARATSRRHGREILGYPEGGFDTITQALKKEISARGGKIYTDTAILKVGHSIDSGKSPRSSSFSLLPDRLKSGIRGVVTQAFLSTVALAKEEACNGQSEVCSTGDVDQVLACRNSFDLCISTLPPHLTSEIFPGYQPPNIKYLGFVGAIVVLKLSFSPHYWINVLDRNAPFGVIVEQGNLTPLSSRALPAESAGEVKGSLNNHILYLGKYTDSTSDFYNLSDKIIAEIARDWLEKINSGAKNGILEIKIFRDPFAQPIVTTKYKKPAHICKIPGFYTTSMAHIFPADRGLNEAVKEAKKIVDLIIDQN